MLRFFGQDAPTAVAAAHTSIKYGSPLIPTRVERLVGSRFRVTFEPPLVTEGKTAAEVTQETLDITERWVREKPAQWFWVHRRWAS